MFETYLTFDDVLLLPNYSEIIPADVDLTTSLSGLLSLKIPILSAPMDTVTEFSMLQGLGELGGLGILHRNFSVPDQAAMLQKALSLPIQAGAAVGVGPDFEKRAAELISLNPTALCVDSAHGFSKNVLKATRYIKNMYPNILLISGNTASYEGAKALFDAGADIVKVGMGSGSICTTRVMSGVGVPQLSAILEAARAAREYKRSIIADGGIRTSGDVVKALAAGASAVMLGSFLAGTDESVGEVIERNERFYKSYRGMGSVASMIRGSSSRYGQSYTEGEQRKLVPEGVEGLVPCKGPLKDLLYQLLGGLRAGFAYMGAKNLNEVHEKARFIRITQAGIVESHPHTIER